MIERKKASLRLMLLAGALSCTAATLSGTLAALALTAPAGALSNNFSS